jgi:anti-sigma regulatory factor (Ser/Thr protein kinase)
MGASQPLSRSLRLVLTRRAASVPVARHRVAEALEQWGLGQITEAASLATAELAANAIQHATGATFGILCQYRDGLLRIEVCDQASAPLAPASAGAAPDRERGHGLLIVAAVTDRWGSRPAGRGKSVWFEITAPRNSKRECALDGEP